MSREIISSVANYADPKSPEFLFRSVEEHVRLAKSSGYSGLEWWPLRTPFAGMQMRMGLLSQYAKEGVWALHQSSRSETSLVQAWQHHNRIPTIASYFLLPEINKSIASLARVQESIGRALPIVLYPTELTNPINIRQPFTEKLFQPTPGVMEQWGVKSVDELISRMTEYGYDGFALDLFHFRKSAEIDLNPWQETLPKLLPLTKEIHVAAGRGDIAQDEIDTNAELRDLIGATTATDLPKILHFINDFGWQGRIVTEITAPSLRHVLGSQSSRMSRTWQVDAHRSVVTTLKDIFS